MGFRIRKSIKILPGVKYNFNKSGGSLSVKGPLGTHNLSKKGVKSTYSLKGTGISYVHQSSKSLSSNKSDLPNQNSVVSGSEHSDRQQNENKSSKIVEEYQRKIDAFSSILRDRERKEFDLDIETADLGAYRVSEYFPPKFVEPKPDFTKDSVKQDVKKKELVRTQFILLLFALAVLFLFVHFVLSLICLFLSVIICFIEGKRVEKTIERKTKYELNLRRNKFKSYRGKLYQDFLAKIENDRAAHHEREAENQKIWQKEKEFRKKIREGYIAGDISTFAELLEGELSNLDLPLPLLFDLEFDDLKLVKIFIKLPQINVVPEEEIKLTKTGKLSVKKMTQKARFKIYSDICSGLTLRLVHEVFRVVKEVSCVEICGISEQVNPANGHPETIRSLYLKISKSEFINLNLDALDQTVAFEAISGQFACSKKGVLFPLKK